MSDDAPLLVVDDDAPFCAALARGLRRRGLRVVVAHTIAEALSEASAWNPSRAIVDLRIEKESGLDLLERLRETCPDLAVVLLTGFGSIPTAVRATKLGAVQYLTKPASIDEILAAFTGHFPRSEAHDVARLDEVEREHLLRVLEECDGNVSEAARRLQMHRRTLQRKLARHR